MRDRRAKRPIFGAEAAEELVKPRSSSFHRRLKHDLLAAPVVALHDARSVKAAGVLRRRPGLRLGGVVRRRRAGPLGVRRHGHAQTHAESLVAARDVVHAARLLRGVVADGRVLVGALGARQREPVGPQEVVQVLVAVAGRQGGAAVAAVQREREAAESRVPARVHGGGGVGVLHDVKLGELLDRRAAVVVRVCRVD